MKKRIFNWCFIILFLVIFLSGCNPSLEDIKRNITLEIVEDTISLTGLTVLLSNKFTHTYMFGENFALKHEISGVWSNVPMINSVSSVILIGYQLPPLSHREKSINWEGWYGHLKHGKYRMEIQVTSNNDSDIECFIISDFEISE